MIYQLTDLLATVQFVSLLVSQLAVKCEKIQ